MVFSLYASKATCVLTFDEYMISVKTLELRNLIDGARSPHQLRFN